ncbi:stage III sporulation protein AG [Aneurinibacillus soli]|uniref:Uncharacterized protein n=1 Tax=Aneurinibacillus soli TaxID=1500254 RepID=A0A0U5B9K3_9BACL|nr:stage III sporulation protein AG [Aneurinibacillus soli]PYE63646.1 stage III sporulation protein AG [Aneurinibacillus soli]BAU27421.1 hypothetical protein CB4_01595 [Aneurinibacillus soli]
MADKGDGKKFGKLQWLLVLGALGVASMLANSFMQFEPNQKATPTSTASDSDVPAFSGKKAGSNSMGQYEEQYEAKLKEVLQTINGVGQVEVMVNLESTEEVVVEKNRNSSTQTTKEADKGATRDITNETNQEQIVLAKSNTGDAPVVTKTIKPKVRGVVIVATGAGNLQVKAWILEAVQRSLGVPSYKISILPKKA